MVCSTCGIINIAIVLLYIELKLVFTEEQSCFNGAMHMGNNTMSPAAGSQVLVPKMTFLCNGTLTNLIVNLTDPAADDRNGDDKSDGGGRSDNDDDDDDDDDGDDKGDDKQQQTDTSKSFPIIQVWRPLNALSYSRMGSYVLSAGDISSEGKLANVSLNEQIIFQSGDIIGYYVPSDSLYSIQNTAAKGNISYVNSTDISLSRFHINNNNVNIKNMLPAIQVVVDNSNIVASVIPVTTSVLPTDATSTTTATNTDMLIPNTVTLVASATTSVTSSDASITSTDSFISDHDIVTSTASVAASVIAVNTITTTTNAVISATPTKSLDILADEEAGSKSSSSSNVGIVVGCVVGLAVCIIIIIILIVLFLWYKKKRIRKGVDTAVHFENSRPKCSVDDSSKGLDHHYSAANYAAVYNAEGGCLGTIKNTDHYAVIDNTHSYNGDSRSKLQARNPVPYLEPTKIANNSSKFTRSDYESLPTHVKQSLVRNYETIEAPYQVLEDPKKIPAVVYENMPKQNAVRSALTSNEQIYEDPGHKKDVIYSWFEKKKFRKIRQGNIRLLQQLGSGEFGVVHLGSWSDGSNDPVQVAVKTLNSQCSESDRVKFLREAAIMGQFKHENIVRLHGVVTEEENMMIVLEYMPKGDLEDVLMNLKITISQETCHNVKCNLLKFSRQVAAGMAYLASKRFVHRDLAARNILVSSDDVCKIADFGMARDVANDTYYITSGGKIPLKWTAPEAIFYKKYSTQSDVWSFGCVLYEIWSLGYRPFEDIDDGTEYIEKITTGYRLPPPPGCPRAIYELMIQCWHPVAKHRPLPASVSQMLQEDNSKLLTSSLDLGQSMMLGDPLTAANQLYCDLQQTYINS